MTGFYHTGPVSPPSGICAPFSDGLEAVLASSDLRFADRTPSRGRDASCDVVCQGLWTGNEGTCGTCQRRRLSSVGVWWMTWFSPF